MEWGRGRTRSALWGGIALGIGTILFALCSPSSVGCATNLIVLTHSAVTARGCAAYSVLAHVGVGLMVFGGVLLLGSFALVLRNRRHANPAEAAPVVVSEPVHGASEPAVAVAVAAAAPAVAEPVEAQVPEAEPASIGPVEREQTVVERRPTVRRRPERVGPIPPGADDAATMDPILLPPGWYGNPDNPGGPIQWWDGTKLVDRPH
jgi:hypothetical protein